MNAEYVAEIILAVLTVLECQTELLLSISAGFVEVTTQAVLIARPRSTKCRLLTDSANIMPGGALSSESNATAADLDQ